LIPGKAPTEEKQMETIKRIKDEMKDEDSILLFFDPCHLQHNVVNAKMWQPIGREGTIKIKSNSGRKRINILGSLNMKDLSVITTLTEQKCNKERIVEFLSKVRNIYLGKRIFVVLDNAMYNHAYYTKKFAEWYDIELFFLPPYAPNINLIERLWKFTKKKLVHNKYYEKFDLFLKEVINYFDNLENYRVELTELLTKKFEIIKNV